MKNLLVYADFTLKHCRNRDGHKYYGMLYVFFFNFLLTISIPRLLNYTYQIHIINNAVKQN